MELGRRNFISVENILASVKMKLRSFDESGLLNDSSMISNIDYILTRTGYSLEEYKPLVLDIYDGTVEIPEDLKFVEIMYKCEICNSKPKTKHTRWYYGLPHRWTVRDYAKRVCYNKCDIDDCEDQITRTIWIDTEEHVDHFCNKKIIKYKKTVPTDKIDSSCPNIHCESEDFFNIKNNKFYFNFTEGHVLLYYTAKKLDEDGYPLVEDDPILLRAIEDYLLLKELETIYWNGEADVLQRLQLARVESAKTLDEALILKKIPSHRRMMEYARAKAKSVQKLNIK